MSKKLLLLFAMTFMISSCSMNKKKVQYGVISTKDVKTGETLVLTNDKIDESSCLYFILGLIPVGNFDVNKIHYAVEDITQEKNLHSLGNVEITSSVKFFFPFYLGICNDIQAQGLRLK